MLEFEWHQPIPEIRTDILVYETGGVINHINAPALVKVEITGLWEKKNLW